MTHRSIIFKLCYYTSSVSYIRICSSTLLHVPSWLIWDYRNANIFLYSSPVRVSLDLLSVQANTGPKWANKSSVAFFRGRDSRKERLELVRLSHRHPDLIDARLTNMFFFKHEEDLGELQKHISFFDFFQVCMTVRIRASDFPFKKIYFPFKKCKFHFGAISF